MQGPLSEQAFFESLAGLLGAYYLLLACANAAAAVWSWRRKTSRDPGQAPSALSVPLLARIYSLLAVAFAAFGLISLFGGVGYLTVPHSLRDQIDARLGPVLFCSGALLLLCVAFWRRRFLSEPAVAWLLLNLVCLLMGLSMTDPDFAKIVSKPDNVAIVGMLFLLGYFTWLGAYQATRNDERLARGEDPVEKLASEKVLVWPDLVYIELICMVALMALLILWGIGLKAPLEEPANSVQTPNPSKAPWYFVGLQEMLYYYDAWMAGVVLPGLIIFGLMAIPYLDQNTQGNGYYTIQQRPFAYLTFQFGFLALWILLIVIGTFLRGPNWDFFGPYETWDAHKVTAQNNVNLSQYFWVEWLGVGMPQAPDDANGLRKCAAIFWRESPGIVLLLCYFAILPPAMVSLSRPVRELYSKIGFSRYFVVSLLLLTMALLPIKMIARWIGDVHYFVAMPEYFLNF